MVPWTDGAGFESNNTSESAMCLKMLLERSQGFRIKPRVIMTRNWAELWLEWEAIGFKVRFLGPSPGKDQHLNMEGARKSCNSLTSATGSAICCARPLPKFAR